jgi:hypothetical protein
MKRQNLRKAFITLLILTISLGFLSLDSPSIVNAQSGSQAGIKKLALPLQQIISGEVTTENSWYKLNTNTPFVQAFVMCYEVTPQMQEKL